MFDIQKDGFVKASLLQDLLTKVAEAVREELDDIEERLGDRIKAQAKEILDLRRELETERRLRLGRRGQ